MQNVYSIPDNTNIGLFSLVAASSLFQFFILPAYLLPLSMAWALAAIPLIPLNNMMWFLIHESIHKNLHSNQNVNKYGGRVLGIMFGPSFHVLAFGHLMHHKLNRNWESENTPDKPGFRQKLKYYFKLIFGVYLTEAAASFIMLFLSRSKILQIATNHNISQEVESYFYRKNRLAEIKVDGIITILLFAASIICFAGNWPILLLILALRAISISLMDNIFHYGTPDDNSVAGKQVKAGKLTSWFILNGNYHGTHHTNPKVPWKHLPDAAQNQNLHLTEQSFAGAMIEQFKGPKLISA